MLIIFLINYKSYFYKNYKKIIKYIFFINKKIENIHKNIIKKTFLKIKTILLIKKI